MIEAAIYFVMQLLGYRLYRFDTAFSRGIPLDSYSGWLWRPRDKRGTYIERLNGYRYAGYGAYI